ncbi:hemerythrin domain-containing protein [Virgibacillus sp. SK37]|uniref:hemerythrin domain-containing protein n=1 Tax=Virgibacillus sp. SK37 TaxID=403957 RepID=UPI0004D19777|nr:hemerythrin domain-containing protein [Virgibacillus sp. SK37]AIF44343.1 cation-binding protein [Virgibacillus sp. SK37]
MSKKGIKRHEVLKPLSRHHMIGLHLALKLKRAGTKESRWTVDQIIQDADQFWKPDGLRHFKEEEEFLLPAFAEAGDLDHPLIQLMLEEHEKIRANMDLLLQHSMKISEMHELGHLLEEHIRREEREIFPMIEQALPEDKLQQLAPYLH